MKPEHRVGGRVLVWSAVLVLSCATRGEPPPLSDGSEMNAQTFMVKGVVRELGTDRKTVVVKHEAVGNYMAAMTMPFKVKEPKELAGLRAGDEISFRLRVTVSESWIEGVVRIGTAKLEESPGPPDASAAEARVSRPRHPLLDFKFTNELNQAVSLHDFRGQALVITFFFTRCPMPEFCPRLSKNFQQAAQKLGSMPGAPTNWHFLSVSFDTEHDSPEVLRAYGEMYHYDPAHWSFLTGPEAEIGELARLSDVTFKREGGIFSHNFRTLVIDATGHLQMIFPMGGDLAQAIVEEIVKAAAAHRPGPRETAPARPPPALPAAAARTMAAN